MPVTAMRPQSSYKSFVALQAPHFQGLQDITAQHSSNRVVVVDDNDVIGDYCSDVPGSVDHCVFGKHYFGN